MGYANSGDPDPGDSHLAHYIRRSTRSDYAVWLDRLGFVWTILPDIGCLRDPNGWLGDSNHRHSRSYLHHWDVHLDQETMFMSLLSCRSIHRVLRIVVYRFNRLWDRSSMSKVEDVFCVNSQSDQLDTCLLRVNGQRGRTSSRYQSPSKSAE